MDLHRFSESSACWSDRRGSGGCEATKHDGRTVDVAFLGTGAAILASAVALSTAFEGMRIAVYDERECLDDGSALCLSPRAWKALSIISPRITMDLLHRQLVCKWPQQDLAMSASSFNEEGVQEPLCVAVGVLLKKLMDLLPPDTVHLGRNLNGIEETADGVVLRLEGGEKVAARLVVSCPGAVPCCGGQIARRHTNYVEADFHLRQTHTEQGPLEVPMARKNRGGIVVCQPAKASDATWFACLLPLPSVYTGANPDRLLAAMCDSLGTQQLLSSTVDWWAGREVFAPNEIQENRHGRVMEAGVVSEFLPHMSPYKAEIALHEALVLRCVISEKGLTPAALRSCEMLMRAETATLSAALTGQDPDWLETWGLSGSTDKIDTEQLPAPVFNAMEQRPQMEPSDVAFARGLKSSMPKDGMGWRIVS